jgi:hypothetical protein
MSSKKKVPKIRKPVSQKPNIVHKDKSKYNRNDEKKNIRKEMNERMKQSLDEIIFQNPTMPLYEVLLTFYNNQEEK